MTPEQRASLPAHPSPREADDRALLSTVVRCLTAVKAARDLRIELEYPPGHPERRKISPGASVTPNLHGADRVERAEDGQPVAGRPPGHHHTAIPGAPDLSTRQAREAGDTPTPTSAPRGTL